MRVSLLLLPVAGILVAGTAAAQTGRTMHVAGALAIGTTCQTSVTFPAPAVGNPYAMLWSNPYPGTTAFSLPGFATNGLLRLDPAHLEVASTGIFAASGVASLGITVPGDAALLGFAFDLQSLDLDVAAASLHFADDDLALTVAGLRQDWAVIYNGAVGGHDYLRAVTTDTAAVFVTGSSLGFRPGSPFNPYTYEIVTQAYDQAGVRLWEGRYDSPGSGFDDTGVDVVQAANGDVVVLGQGPGASGDQDVVLLRYDAQGTRLWVTTWNHTWSDGASDLAIAADGSIYVLASGTNPGTITDITLLKYTAGGQLLWQRFFDGGFGTDVGVGMGFDSHGNIAIGGYSVGATVGTNFDWMALEYDPNGNLLWSTRLVGSPTLPDYCWGMTVDALDRVVLTGTLANSPGGYALAAFADGGAHLWTSLLGVGGGAPYCEVRGDAAGNLFCASNSSVVAVDAAGVVLWQQTVSGQARALALDANGHVFVTSSILAPGANSQFVLKAFRADGSNLGERVFGAPLVDEFAPRGLAVLGNAVYAVGSTQNASRSNDGYLTKFTMFP